MSGNGVDRGQIVSMLRSVLEAQEQTRVALLQMRSEFGRRLDEQAHRTADLRKEVAMYHESVVGHGILISELDERVRRLEDRADPSRAA